MTCVPVVRLRDASFRNRTAPAASVVKSPFAAVDVL